jgi:hypothetical protein
MLNEEHVIDVFRVFDSISMTEYDHECRLTNSEAVNWSIILQYDPLFINLNLYS